jgi:hypothetical protein
MRLKDSHGIIMAGAGAMHNSRKSFMASTCDDPRWTAHSDKKSNSSAGAAPYALELVVVDEHSEPPVIRLVSKTGKL